jgi:hypothetical protein
MTDSFSVLSRFFHCSFSVFSLLFLCFFTALSLSSFSADCGTDNMRCTGAPPAGKGGQQFSDKRKKVFE